MSRLPTKLRERIDACRPGSADLEQPEMQPLAEALRRDPDVARAFARSQQLDAAIGRAVLAGPAPDPGFEQRLLARLAAANDDPPATADASDASLSAAAEPATGSLQSEPLRGSGGDRSAAKSWLAKVAVVAATLAAAVMLAVWLSGRPPLPINDQELLQLAAEWNAEVSASSWREDAPPRDRFPLAREIPSRVTGWQTLWLDRARATACCYRLAVADQGEALLFVVPDARNFQLPPTPPPAPLSTQGRSVAGWITDDVAYVLSFEGLGRYDRIIRRPTTAAVMPAEETSPLVSRGHARRTPPAPAIGLTGWITPRPLGAS